MKQSEILSKLHSDLDGSKDAYQLIKLTTETETLIGQGAIKNVLSSLNIHQGWITFPERVAIIDRETELQVKQAPLEAEFVTDNATIKIRYLGGDAWLLSRYQLIECQADNDDITHLATSYREKMVKGEQGFLEYKRLWSYSPDKGMYIEHAVLQGFSGAQQ